MEIMERWPNLFIVGAPKAGTTSLHEYLKKIPGVFMSEVKEPYYFCKTIIPIDHYVTPIREKKKYLELFEKSENEKMVGESSVWYLSDPDASTLIYQQVPNAKIIILLRDPVERAFSHYLMLEGRKQFKLSSFHEQIQKEIKEGLDYKTPHVRLESGLYYNDIKRFLETFGKKQVKIIIFEEFIANTKEILGSILEFLNVNASLNNFEAQTHNPSVVAKYPLVNELLNISIVSKLRQKIIPEQVQRNIKKKLFKDLKNEYKMTSADRELLKKYYNDDVKKLEGFFGRRLPWVNFSDI